MVICQNWLVFARSLPLFLYLYFSIMPYENLPKMESWHSCCIMVAAIKFPYSFIFLKICLLCKFNILKLLCLHEILSFVIGTLLQALYHPPKLTGYNLVVRLPRRASNCGALRHCADLMRQAVLWDVAGITCDR